MNQLVKVIARREGVPVSEALEMVKDMAAEVNEGADPEEVLYDWGLEPDYVIDLLSFC